MYTKRIYSLPTLIRWTRYEILLLLAIAAIPPILFDLLGQRWLHLPWLPIALIGTAVAFVLGFQNNATYGRIWEARKIWGGIVNHSRAWGMLVNDFLSQQFRTVPLEEEQLQAAKKKLILRHIAWLTALRHAMRQPRSWEHLHRDRTNREWSKWIEVREHNHTLEEELEGKLSSKETESILAKANPAAQLLALQSRQLKELRGQDVIDDFRHMEMERVLTALLECQGKSERIKNFPYPRQYATLNVTFVWIFLLLIPFGLIGEFDSIGTQLSETYPLAGRIFIWLSLPFSAMVMWIFHTMERIGRVGENPFEGSPNDVPITTMARGIEIDLLEMLGENPASIPPAIRPKCDAQT